MFQVKRKDILDLSREFDLTGFCLPGKPGIICVEGLAHNTDDWWHKVGDGGFGLCIVLYYIFFMLSYL